MSWLILRSHPVDVPCVVIAFGVVEAEERLSPSGVLKKGLIALH